MSSSVSFVVIGAKIQLGKHNCVPTSDYNTRFEARNLGKVYNRSPGDA